MPTTTNLNTLKINYLTQAQYEAALANEQINENEIYLTPSLEAESAPIGAIQSYAGSTAPRGWLICDGSAILRTAYSELFEVIGTTYGAGDGSTTFNLPDLRGRTAIGSGLGTAEDAIERTLGQSGGSERVTLSVEQMPAHTHEIREEYGNTASSSFPPNNTNSFISGKNSSTKVWTDDPISYAGGNASHGNMQPYLTINYIIKAKDFRAPYIPQTDSTSILNFFYPVGSYYETSDTSFDPNTAWGGTWVKEVAGQVHVSAGTGYTVSGANNNTSDGGETTHTLTINEMPSHSHYAYLAGGSIASGTGRLSWEYNTAQKYGASIDNMGGGQAHNNMPPYVVVNRWHRTA